MYYFKQGLLQFVLSLLLISNFSSALAAKIQPFSFSQFQKVLPETAINRMQMPVLDQAVLMQQDRANPSPAHRFATSQETLITPKTHGTWETVTISNGVKRIWRMTVQSIGAVSLNLTFTKFSIPVGGELFIYAPNHQQVLGPYSQKDSNSRKQLWTPIILGDTIVIEVNLPASKENELVLELTKINHGYKAATAKTTGSCNIDIACPVGDSWKDQSRSVVSYTFGTFNPATNRTDTFVCSGAMINNTAQDNTSYLLTANHCKVTAANSDTVTVYWNYQNSTCRTGLNTNGGAGDGLRTNSLVGGTSYISSYATTDVRLLKIIKPIPVEYNVFYAGWDRSQTIAPKSVASIHHPNGEEKRISITNNPALLSIDFNGIKDMIQVKDSHIRIVWWTAGTTEGGSSGSPLFDENKRIVGQLSGGGAACGTDPTKVNNGLSDWYGRFKLSWDGDTNIPSATNRLSDWLDPSNTGATFINGKNANDAVNVNLLENSIPQAVPTTNALSSQNYTISVPPGASNLNITIRGTNGDADLYIKFGSSPSLTLFDDRAWTGESNEDVVISTPQAGTHHIKVYGFSGYSNLTLTASYDLAGTVLKVFGNTTDVKIINEATINSFINSNYINNAGTMTIDVDIKHSDNNDLTINLIAPNNQKFNLKTNDININSQNFIQSQTFDIPSGISNGQWRLEVIDNAKLDSGFIDSWKITLP